MKLLFLVSAILFFASSTCWSDQDGSVHNILSACRSISQTRVSGDKVTLPSDFNTGYCFGAFAVIQKMAPAILRGEPIHGVCAPPESSLVQLIAIFVRYADENPNRWHEDYVWFAVESLKVAFPCSAD